VCGAATSCKYFVKIGNDYDDDDDDDEGNDDDSINKIIMKSLTHWDLEKMGIFKEN